MYWINIVSSCIITSFGIMIALKNISEKNTKRNYFIFFILHCIICFFIFLFAKDLNKLLLNFIITIILNYYFYQNKNIKNSIYYSTIVIILSTCTELLFTIIVSILLKFKNNYDFSSSYSIVIFTIINTISIIFITNNKRFNNLIKKIKIFDNIIYYIMLSLLFISTIIIFNNYYNVYNTKAFILNLIFYFLIIMIFLYSVISNINKSKISSQYNQMLDYVTEYEDIINEQGKKNHEYKNQLMILDGFLEEKKYKQVKEYLNTIIGDQTFGQNYKIKQLSNFPNGGIKGLMYYKINKMEENKIKYFLYVSEDVKKNFENIDLNLYKDITKIFGVIIDNAIDAALESKKKEIVIDLKTEDNFIVINIDNTYINKNIKKVGKKGYSTKGKGHGFGLSLVKDIIRKNSRLELNSDFNDNYYTQTLFIEIKKN